MKHVYFVALTNTLLVLLVALVTSIKASKYEFQNLKETNIVFYMHDIASSPNATATPIAGVPNQSWSIIKFGSLSVLDDKLTVGSDHNSTQIGRAHGIYLNSALDGSDLFLLLSVIFTSREYDGSTLEIQGADRFHHKYRDVSDIWNRKISTSKRLCYFGHCLFGY